MLLLINFMMLLNKALCKLNSLDFSVDAYETHESPIFSIKKIIRHDLSQVNQSFIDDIRPIRSPLRCPTNW